jgi:K+-sensing histidine kinase KdpD
MSNMIELEDECGRRPPAKAEDLFKPFERRGIDQTGLGLALTISLRSVQPCGVEIQIRDLPGSGACSRSIYRERRPQRSRIGRVRHDGRSRVVSRRVDRVRRFFVS